MEVPDNTVAGYSISVFKDGKIRFEAENGGQNSTRSTATLKPTKPNPG